MFITVQVETQLCISDKIHDLAIFLAKNNHVISLKTIDHLQTYAKSLSEYIINLVSANFVLWPMGSREIFLKACTYACPPWFCT